MCLFYQNVWNSWPSLPILNDVSVHHMRSELENRSIICCPFNFSPKTDLADRTDRVCFKRVVAFTDFPLRWTVDECFSSTQVDVRTHYDYNTKYVHLHFCLLYVNIPISIPTFTHSSLINCATKHRQLLLFLQRANKSLCLCILQIAKNLIFLGYFFDNKRN